MTRTHIFALLLGLTACDYETVWEELPVSTADTAWPAGYWCFDALTPDGVNMGRCKKLQDTCEARRDEAESQNAASVDGACVHQPSGFATAIYGAEEPATDAIMLVTPTLETCDNARAFVASWGWVYQGNGVWEPADYITECFEVE